MSAFIWIKNRATSSNNRYLLEQKMITPVSPNVHQQLLALLDQQQARYRVMTHEAVNVKPFQKSAEPR